MAAGVAFLQSDVDEAHKPVGAYKPGNTDVIRQMLREQQRSMGALHANALFREFRGDGERKRFGKGYAPPPSDMPAVDDFQAEGQARMFELIRQTAMRDEISPSGVWASFGKAYECLGTPEEVRHRPRCSAPQGRAAQQGSRACKHEHQCEGPHTCRPQLLWPSSCPQPQSKLPPLNRDDIANMEKARK